MHERERVRSGVGPKFQAAEISDLKFFQRGVKCTGDAVAKYRIITRFSSLVIDSVSSIEMAFHMKCPCSKYDERWASGILCTGGGVTCGWAPNPEPRDEAAWGGPWGKPCGHNEVVMHVLRPFQPMEVINTRICSRCVVPLQDEWRQQPELEFCPFQSTPSLTTRPPRLITSLQRRARAGQRGARRVP